MIITEKFYDAEYASEVMDTVPYGFIDKSTCGCGITTVAIESKEDCIIAVPNVTLVHNKADQYPNTRCSYKLLPVYGGITAIQINKYITEVTGKQPIKIICTWDSLFKCNHLIKSGIRLIVDESDNIITNIKLKTDKRDDRSREDIINYMLDLAETQKNKVSFVTATPIPLNYLPKWISEIPYIKMHWSNTLPVTPIMMPRQLPYLSLKDEIIIPLRDEGAVTLTSNNKSKTFKKIIVFINSVKNITEICRECNLDKDEVSIMCGDTISNDAKVRGYNKLTYNKLKKFNFITSVGNCGIDLYDDDDCMNVVVSCTDTPYHMVDLATTLKQAISRNRSKNNSCKDSYIFIYNQELFKKSNETLIKDIEAIKDRISENIRTLNGLSGKEYSALEKTLLQAVDFYTYAFKKDDVYVFNELRFNADMYFIKEVRKNFEAGFKINIGKSKPITIYPSKKTYKGGISYSNLYKLISKGEDVSQYEETDEYRILTEYYKAFGKYNSNKTRAVERLLKKEEDELLYTLKDKIRFSNSELYKTSEVKEKIQNVYNETGIKRTAQTSDLKDLRINYKIVAIHGERFYKFGR